MIVSSAVKQSLSFRQHAHDLPGTLRRVAENPRVILALYGLVVMAISIYSLVFFLTNRVYLISSDSIYYISIADSILETGSVLDLTSVPAMPPVTPQNAIVYIHVFMASIGLELETRMIVLVVINYLLFLSALYPLHKIARRLGINGSFQMAALLGVYLGAFQIYRMQLLPINDGIFTAGAIWLSYLILIGLQDFPDRHSPEESTRIIKWRYVFVAIALLSMGLVHFRVNLLLLLGSGLVAAVVAKRYRFALLMIGILTLGIVSIALPIVSVVGDESFLRDTPFELAKGIYAVAGRTLPNLLFKDAGEQINLMYGAFGLALLLGVITGLKKREPGILFISLASIATILYVAALFAQPYRYLLYVFPMLYLLILLSRNLRPIGYMFIALVLVSSLITFYRGFERSPTEQFFVFLSEQQVALPDDSLLFSKRARYPYFYIGERVVISELTLDHITSGKDLFLLGDGEYISTQLAAIESLTDSSSSDFGQRTLTPGYHDEEGWALIQIYDVVPGGLGRSRQ